MAEAPLAYAAIVLVIALIAGLIPVFSKIKQNPERLKMITSIAAGIIIASESGCRITDLNGHGHELEGESIVITNNLIHDEFLAESRPYLN